MRKLIFLMQKRKNIFENFLTRIAVRQEAGFPVAGRGENMV